MEATTEAIVDLVDTFDGAALAPSTRHEVHRRLVDTMACALGGMKNAPATIGRELAGEVRSSHGASVLGLAEPSSVEAATFANAIMLRYLDYNDTWFSPLGGGGHPSDLIAACLAVAESVQASGAELVESIALAYEVWGRLAGTVRIREKGWDQGLFVVVAAAVAAGRMFGLSRAQLADAVSLAVIPNIPTRRTRAGKLAMWKGCATAGASRAGVFAASLAARGMTGPPDPFEGPDGIWQQVTGPFELPTGQPGAGEWVVERTHVKPRPAEYNSQGPLDLLDGWGDRLSAGDIERIDLDTYWLCWSEIGSEPEKWRPTNRETADHSLPFILATRIVDGELRRSSFTAEKWESPAVLALMDRIRITEDPELTRAFPDRIPARMRIALTDGVELSGEIDHPTGHSRNPVGDDVIDAKFTEIVDGWDGANRQIAAELHRDCWRIESLRTVGDLTGLFRALDTGSALIETT